MAPEVVMGSEISAASDIWSLGCTIIEMITGKPPFWDVGSFAAMFRITEDNHPPIPDNLSDELNNFLLCCFQKDISIRSSAIQLLDHPWIIGERDRTVSSKKGN